MTITITNTSTNKTLKAANAKAAADYLKRVAKDGVEVTVDGVSWLFLGDPKDGGEYKVSPHAASNDFDTDATFLALDEIEDELA